MLSIETITLAIVALLNAMLVWLIISQGWHSIANRYFASVVFFSTVWSIGVALFYAANTTEFAQFALMLFYVGPMFMLLSLCYFATVFHSKKRLLTVQNIIFTILTVLLAVFITGNQAMLTAQVVVSEVAQNSFEVNPFWYTVYALYLSFGFLIVFTELIANIRRNRGFRKKQLAYITAAMAIVILLSSVTNISMPILGVTSLVWIGPFCTFFAVIIITLSIIKHALFDIKLAAIRSTVYTLTLITLAATYYLLAYIVSMTFFEVQADTQVSVSPVNIILALVLAFLFQPIKKFFDKATNNIFYKDRYDKEYFFARLNQILSSTIDLKGLLEMASEHIAGTLKAEQVFFYIRYDSESQRYMSAGTKKHKRLPLEDVRMLDEYVAQETTQSIIVGDSLPEDSPIRKMFKSHGVALIMPLWYSESTFGYLMLGDHLTGSYSKRDLSVLQTISNSLVIAMQNAISLHEVKELNATLQQRIDVATKELRASNAQLKHLDQVKDEFMSMASHQLRTPLTSVKGYLSMVLDGDAGQVTPQQKKLLTEAFSSSERMVRLIADFLNVSRLQTGKFVIEKSNIDFKSVVVKEVDNLRIMAVSRKLKIVLSAPKSGVIIYGDAGKLREVVMNFIDNAIYYSKPDTEIKVEILQREDVVEFMVHDTGIGVPKKEQNRLFSKFFRATNARQQRPDGTGVGLYLAKKIITAHGGKMLFQSTEGKGSTFGFWLPLPVLDKDTDDTNKK